MNLLKDLAIEAAGRMRTGAGAHSTTALQSKQRAA
jgi:hypothetical protein